MIEPTIKQSLEAIHEYLADVDFDFWENCTCDLKDKDRDIESPEECTCEANKDHILRHYIVLGKFLRSMEQDPKEQLKEIKEMEEKENVGL